MKYQWTSTTYMITISSNVRLPNPPRNDPSLSPRRVHRPSLHVPLYQRRRAHHHRLWMHHM